MSLTDAVRTAFRHSRQAADGDKAVLYAEVTKLLRVTDPTVAPNPESVCRIGRRLRRYGLARWQGVARD